MDKNQDEYIPALKYSWMTSLHDPLLERGTAGAQTK